MTAVATMWRTDRSRLIGLIGIAVGLAMVLLNLGFLFRAGTSEVLTGLAYNAFVLGWILLITSGSRTVSLATLGAFWLLGVWAVTGLAYLLEQGMIDLSGVETSDDVVPVWFASVTEEGLKPLAVVLYFVLASRRNHRWPSISDGLLLGFVVGWGLKFHEDAHIGIVTGHGWGVASPWTTFFPTTELWNDFLYNDHAVRGALEGLSVGAAAMLWHWRRAAWLVGLAGPALMFWGHVMWNHFAGEPGEATGSADAPFLYATLRDLLDGGRLPVLVLLIGAVAAVVAELMILRWIGKRDRRFPALPVARVLPMLKRWNTRAGLAELVAVDRYLTLRRSVYYAGWRSHVAGAEPVVMYADHAELNSLAARLEILPQPAQPSPAAPTSPADAMAAAVPASDAPVGDAPVGAG